MAVDISLLNYYKDLYSGHKLIYVRFLGEDFIFRTLTRKEYKFIAGSTSDKLLIQDKICDTCCIYPEEYEFETCGFAGLNEYASDVILDLSGLKDVRTIIQNYNNMRQYTNLEIQCMDLIKAFIPEHTYEEMEEWTWQKLIYMTVRAEKVAQLKGFDWHLEDLTEEFVEEINQMNMNNKEFLDQLRKDGVDPMYFFAEDLQAKATKEIIDFPIIGGIHWNDEVILNAIRKQKIGTKQ